MTSLSLLGLREIRPAHDHTQYSSMMKQIKYNIRNLNFNISAREMGCVHKSVWSLHIITLN